MKLTETEWVVMKALWAGYPATAREIVERLPREVNWAYPTVKTLLSRLVEKQGVAEQKRGNTSVYEPRLSQTVARKSALKTLANQAFDGAFGPLLHFLVDEQNLTARQRAEVLKVLEEKNS